MVNAMAFDRFRLPGVAWMALGIALSGCKALQPPAPPPEPGPIAPPQKPRPIELGAGRHVLVGEMCQQGAAGRPAVLGIATRGVQWTDNASEVGAAIERGSVPRFVVFGVDGKPAGTFDTLGLVDVGLSQPVASGTYAGASPCSAATLAGKDHPGARVDDPRCVQVTQSCGLAVGEVTRPDDPPQAFSFAPGGACVAGDQLAVDIDGDGQVESFPLAGVLDGIRGPASEWVAAPTAGAACTPQFQTYDVRLVATPDPGKPVDPKTTVMLDVLGVVDLDGDGRKELVLALRFATVRSIVIYSATQMPRRLELVGEGASFPR
jgi:hypothetical protein